MTNEYQIIGSWIENGEKQWEPFSNKPISLEKAEEILAKLKSNPAPEWKENNIYHEEYITSWSNYEKMLKDDK